MYDDCSEGLSMKEIIYTSPFDSQKLKAYFYEVNQPKAFICIFHGMAEHQLRYRKLAEFLNQNHFSVLTIDHRGHGESLFDGNLKGYFANEDGWHKNLDDMHAIIHQVKPDNIPFILFGHSMGSLVARSYLKKYGEELSGLYLSGSPDESPMASVGITLAKLIRSFKGKKHASPFMTKLSFGSFNKAIKDPKTTMDWLSINEENVKKYIQDDLCGYDFTTQAYVDMLEGIHEVYHDTWNVLNPELPIQFVSGEFDPCFLPNGLEKAANRLKELGYRNVNYSLVIGCRHEIFNETKRDEVFDSFINWLNNVVNVN